MTRIEAIGRLHDGHTIWTPKCARDICKAVGVAFDKNIVRSFRSDPDGTPKGLRMREEGTDGVDGLELARYVAEKLGVADKAGSYIGRGFQAQAYGREIEKALVLQT